MMHGNGYLFATSSFSHKFFNWFRSIKWGDKAQDSPCFLPAFVLCAAVKSGLKTNENQSAPSVSGTCIQFFCNLNRFSQHSYLIQVWVNQYKCSSNPDTEYEWFPAQKPHPRESLKVSGSKSNSPNKQSHFCTHLNVAHWLVYSWVTAQASRQNVHYRRHVNDSKFEQWGGSRLSN